MMIFWLSYSSAQKVEVICFSEISVDFNRLHSVISQKIELFLATSIRTANLIIFQIVFAFFSDSLMFVVMHTLGLFNDLSE